MKTILLSLLTIVFTLSVNAQISLGLQNDFEDGTTQGWSNGGSSPNPPVNIADGGPNGSGDNYLEEMSSGGSGAGSRLVMFNVNSEWQGNYSNTGADVIRFDARNSSADNNISLRVALSGGSDDTEISTTEMVVLTPSSDWTEVSFEITSELMTLVGGSNTIEEVLADVQEIRILSNPSPSFIGESIVATLDVDNIEVDTLLGLNDPENSVSFELVPNPASNKINIAANHQINSYRILNVLGKLVMEGVADNNNIDLDISSLNSGLYLVEVISTRGKSVAKLVKR